MSLIKCSECGKEFSNKASECPNCGCPVVSKKTKVETTDNVSNDNYKNSQLAITNKVIFITIGIVLVIGIIILCVTTMGGDNRVLGTYVQRGGVGTTLILGKNNVCSMSIADQNSSYPSTISNCHWSISGNNVTINYTLSVSNGYLSYTRDTTLNGTYNGNNITMSGGAIYNKQ